MRLCENEDSLPAMKMIYQNYCSNDIQSRDDLEDLVDLLQVCRDKGLLPMLYFHIQSSVVKDIYEHLDKALRTREEQDYPYHYHILEKKINFIKSI